MLHLANTRIASSFTFSNLSNHSIENNIKEMIKRKRQKSLHLEYCFNTKFVLCCLLYLYLGILLGLNYEIIFRCIKLLSTSNKFDALARSTIYVVQGITVFTDMLFIIIIKSVCILCTNRSIDLHR
jgi:hypothetical protein